MQQTKYIVLTTLESFTSQFLMHNVAGRIPDWDERRSKIWHVYERGRLQNYAHGGAGDPVLPLHKLHPVCHYRGWQIP